MRDIREDLKERLNIVQTEISRLNDELSILKAQEDSLSRLLEVESAQWRPDRTRQPALFPAPEARQHAQFSAFIREALQDEHPKTLEELKLLAVQQGMK